MILMTPEALKVMTIEQKGAILYLCDNLGLDEIMVTKGDSLNLPEGYLAFVEKWKAPDVSPIYGGIAPNGLVST
jgi:hypothetical protein